MSDDPVVDGRDRDDIRAEIAAMAPYYTDDWSPEAGGPGATLLELYAELAADVVERLDRAPEMHRVAFFDELGFGQRPPQPASAPLAFTVADGANDNVSISPGTRAVAPATDSRPEQSFRIGTEDAFEATPANLTHVYSVDPATDHIAEHLSRLETAESSPLFEGDDEQQHICYIGHANRLTLGPDAPLTVEVESALSKPALEALTWEYYGKRPGDDEADWRDLPLRDTSDGGGSSSRGGGSSGKGGGSSAGGGSGGSGGGGSFPFPGQWTPFDPGTILPNLPRDVRARSGSGVAGMQQSLASKLDEAGYRLATDSTSTPQRRLLAEVVAQGTSGKSSAGRDAVSRLFPDEEAARIVLEHQAAAAAAQRERDQQQTGGTGADTGAGQDAPDELTFDPGDIDIPSGFPYGPGGPFVPPWVSGGQDGGDGGEGDGDIELAFSLDGTIETTTVAGTESKWIRCRIPDDESWAPYLDAGIEPSKVGTDRDGLSPDLYANDVPMPRESDGFILPFGETPRQLDAFHIGSTEAFTKAGATAEVDITPLTGSIGGGGTGGGTVGPGSLGSSVTGGAGGLGLLDPVQLPDGIPGQEQSGQGGQEPVVDGSGTSTAPSVSWEYWNGDGWTGLPDLKYKTNNGWKDVSKSDGSVLAFKTDGRLQFTVPPDLEKTKVGGHDGHWIRARFVGGEYIERSFTATGSAENPESWTQQTTGSPPVLDDLTVSYEQEGTPEDVVTTNNLTTRDRDLSGETRLEPFTGPAVDTQTVYFGFDGTLRDGPLTLLVDVTDREYPPDFYPRFRWEYCVDHEEDEWARLDVADETQGLTERGIVSLVFPEDTTATPRFGSTRHWIRARTTNDEFTAPLVVESTRQAIQASDDTQACGAAIETTPATGMPKKRPPSVTSIHPNAGWAMNVRRITDEVLGTSDGTPEQSFTPTQQPVLDAEVWVDELATLSAGRREALLSEHPDRVSIDTAANGDLQAFWVAWERVDDFLQSDRDDRHFVLETSTGAIRFGDGSRGMIPPRGSDNVRATYTTGGGASGNVTANAITELKSSVAFVDAVTNPVAADGGADAESNNDVVDRAPKQLRDRDRAVTAADLERVALDSARKLERARCIPAMNQAGEHQPGWVTLLVVPSSPDPRPTPSVSLREQVREAVASRAALTLVDPDRLVVRGPSYVEVSVTADLVVDGPSVGTIEERAAAAVADYCHPLTGDLDGTGWAFGELPCRSDCYAVLEAVEGVDHVTELEIVISASGSTVTLEEDESTPSVSADAMVFGDTHEMRGRRSDAAGRSGRSSGGDR